MDIGAWRPVLVTLVVDAASDPLYASHGMTVANALYLVDLITPTGTVAVTLTDTLGWLKPPRSFSVSLPDLSHTPPVTVSVPITATLGATDTVTVVVGYVGRQAAYTDTFLVSVVAMADLSIAKSAQAAAVEVEGLVTYTTVITNSGPDAASGVVVTDTLPPAYDYQQAAASQGTCAHGGGTMVCAVGALSAGARVTVTVVGVASAPGLLHNHVEVQASELDADPADNLGLCSTTVQAPAVKNLYLPVILRRSSWGGS